MRGFKPGGHAQRFLSVFSVVGNLFRVGRQKVSAATYRMLRNRSFGIWREASCIGWDIQLLESQFRYAQGRMYRYRSG